MSDIRKRAVAATSRLELRDAADQPMFADGDDGKPDTTKPQAVILYGPGSKQFQQAKADRDTATLEAIRKKGKDGQFTTDEARAFQAQFLTDCTQCWEFVEYDDKKGDDLSVAIYSDITLGFIANQVEKFVGNWGNFTPRSTTTSASSSDKAPG